MQQSQSTIGYKLFMAALFYAAYHYMTYVGGLPAVFGVFLKFFAVLLVLLCLKDMLFMIRWWLLIKHLLTPTGLFGRSYKPEIAHIREMGLSFENKGGKGVFLAGKDGQCIYYTGDAHISFMAATGGGKTYSSSANICMSLGSSENIVATGKGLELYQLTADYRKTILGQNVILIDPFNMSGGQGQELNPLDDLIDYIAAHNPEALDIAASKAITIIPDNPKAGDNVFFTKSARSILDKAIIAAVWWQTETGELTANLPYLKNVLCGSDQDLRVFLRLMQTCPLFKGAVKKEADKFLAFMENGAKTAMSIRAELATYLAIFDEGSTLGSRIELSSFNIEDILTKPTTLYIAIPPDKILTHGTYAGLVIDMLIGLCLRQKQGEVKRRVNFVLDEFGNLSPGKTGNIIPAFYLGRSLGCRLITYVQDTEIYARYGDEKTAFESQAEVYMAWNIRKVRDAKNLSERAGQQSVVTVNPNLPVGSSGTMTGSYSLGAQERGLPLYRPDEFLQMPDHTAALFYKQNPPIMVDLVHIKSIKPYCEYVGNLPGDNYQPSRFYKA
jgi:type IV secretion system protein VirD4